MSTVLVSSHPTGAGPCCISVWAEGVSSVQWFTVQSLKPIVHSRTCKSKYLNRNCTILRTKIWFWIWWGTKDFKTECLSWSWHLQIGLSLTLLQFLFVSLVLELFLSPPYSLWRVHLLGLPCLVTFIFVYFDLSSLVLVSTSVFKLPVLFWSSLSSCALCALCFPSCSLIDFINLRLVLSSCVSLPHYSWV